MHFKNYEIQPETIVNPILQNLSGHLKNLETKTNSTVLKGFINFKTADKHPDNVKDDMLYELSRS